MTIDVNQLRPVEFYTLNSLPRGSAYKGTITNNCNVPFYSLSVNMDGLCFLCRCDAHLPISVGTITDFDRLEDIWTNPIARELQQTVTNKTFDYCAVNHCGIINNDVQDVEHYISINIDESCNLACPTCRKSAIFHTEGDVFTVKQQQIKHFVDLINKFDQPLLLTMSGNGDPLASIIMRPLVLNWQPKSNQHIKLFTNGLLMSKLLPDSKVLPNISEFQISVDAGSAEVYEQVRRPGRFDILEKNLDWLSLNRPSGADVRLMFCLSSANAHDIVAFSELCQRYGFRGEISKVDNWYTFDDFDSVDIISNPAHQLYSIAVDQLQQVSKLDYITISPSVLSKL
jgi:hypothetical protein